MRTPSSKSSLACILFLISGLCSLISLLHVKRSTEADGAMAVTMSVLLERLGYACGARILNSAAMTEIGRIPEPEIR